MVLEEKERDGGEQCYVLFISVSGGQSRLNVCINIIIILII